jgi:hypothetical protein
MSKKVPAGMQRIEIWLFDKKAEYANQVAASFKMPRKLYLQDVINMHLIKQLKTIRPVTQTKLPLLTTAVKKTKKKASKKR